MPTTLERTMVTHTPPVQRYLQTAARAWPEDRGSARALILHLLDEGARAIRQRGLQAAYEAAYAEWEGTEESRLWDVTARDGIEGDE
ncbi:MAG: hypothetical protein LBH13_07300 [Cellulomonadaceae bacterium]|nr:hypothetical protein [Cellulomonadaceae bacterium]